MIRSKKAVEVMSNWPFWMLYAIAVGFTSVALVNIANIFVAGSSEIPSGVEDELLLAQRFYNSGDCFAYTDGAGNVYAGVIDSDKFKQENIGKCFPYSNVNYAFSLSLQSAETDLDLGPISTSNWFEEFGAKKLVQEVIIMHNGVKYSGELEINIQNV